MTQLSLPLKKPVAVDVEQVRRMPSMSKAIVLCADIGGFENDKDFCRQMNMDQGVWSQIQSGTRYFPHDKYEQLFDVCGNEAPLVWLADRRGYELVHLESELEKQVRQQRERAETAEAENAMLKKLFIGRAE